MTRTMSAAIGDGRGTCSFETGIVQPIIEGVLLDEGDGEIVHGK